MPKSPILLEVATFTPTAAITAANAGAHRIELCSGYSEGGLSPSVGTIEYVRKMISIPIHVMIRPRIGDFIYNQVEKQCIINEITFCKKNAINGIVIGALDEDGNIDKQFVREVVKLSKPMAVTFHRAFDLCPNLQQALNDLIECGVHRVLTSGGEPNVTQGFAKIAMLVSQANGRIVILPGGGVNAQNVNDLITKAGVTEVHFSGKELVNSKCLIDPKLSLTSCNDVSDNKWFECSESRIKEIKLAISK
jgi:copper homeostasis protein